MRAAHSAADPRPSSAECSEAAAADALAPGEEGLVGGDRRRVAVACARLPGARVLAALGLLLPAEEGGEAAAVNARRGGRHRLGIRRRHGHVDRRRRPAAQDRRRLLAGAAALHGAFRARRNPSLRRRCVSRHCQERGKLGSDAGQRRPLGFRIREKARGLRRRWGLRRLTSQQSRLLGERRSLPQALRLVAEDAHGQRGGRHCCKLSTKKCGRPQAPAGKSTQVCRFA
mmetsp:Transcript_54527/g.157664  ORF Transcript_54527/g.157664 Transcript_54527/m.157664 type:complete len:229 (+) Transcript_54527:208-894(+)